MAAGSGDEGHSSAVTTADTTPEATPVRELPERRTATSNTFALGDGSRETVVFQSPVNYRDEDGGWKPIDEDLRDQSDGSGLTNGANSFDLSFPERMGDGAVRLDAEEGWVSSELLGFDTAPATVEGTSATYEAGGEGVSFELTSISTGVKETIELDGPSQPRIFRFRLDTSTGVTPSLSESGAIEFRNAEGEFVAETPAPFMEDSSEVPQVSTDVHYQLSPDGPGLWILTVNADSNWLNDPERVWPARIDPTTVMVNPNLDCQISKNESTSGTTYGTPFCSTATWNVDRPRFARGEGAGATTTTQRALMKFNLSAIPKTAAVSSASLKLYHSNEYDVLPESVWLRAILQEWSSSVTWLKRTSTADWTTPGGYTSSEGDYVESSEYGKALQWWTFDGEGMRRLVGKWVNGQLANNGLQVKVGNENPCSQACNRGEFSFYNAGGSSPLTKPQLSLTYFLAAPSKSKVTSPTDGTKSAKRFLLTSAWDHSGVSGVTFQYKTASNPWADIPANQVIDSNNQNVAWPYPVTDSKDRKSRPLYWNALEMLSASQIEKKFQIRAILSGDPGADGFTPPVEAEIHKKIGGPKDATAPIGPGSVDLLTGNFSISKTDLSIPAFNSALEFSRTFSSRTSDAESNGILGTGWRPSAPVELAGGSAWAKVTIQSLTEEEETYKWAELSDPEGGIIAFEEDPSGKFITPPEISGMVLYRNTSNGNIELTDPDGNRTVFSNNGSGNEYLPVSVGMTGGSGNKTRMIYQVEGSKRRLEKMIAPAAPGIECPDTGSSVVDGCRLLVFTYQNAKTWGAPESAGMRLSKITYYASGHGGPWDVASYTYNAQGRLATARDPRLPLAQQETYTYNASGQIATLTPGALKPWTFEYKELKESELSGDGGPGRLSSVSRASLVESKPTATTTIAYDVPLTGGSGRPSMQGADVAAWGQQDLPVDATAIFPPDEVPASPPSSYTRATIYYMDAEGQTSNVASPAGAGTSEPSITTSETDRFGNVVRELTAQNRLRALATESCEVGKVCELDTQFRYSEDGTELQEELGPIHQIRLEGSGELKQARQLRTIQYDKDFTYINGTSTPSAGETKPHLPTTESLSAQLTDGSVVEKRSTEYLYDWKLRKSTATITDPGSGAKTETKSVTVYDEKSGLPTERRQPENSGGGGAGTTKFVYYQDDTGSGGECKSDRYAGLLCKVEPAAQLGTSGQPKLPVKSFLAYNQLGQPLEVNETVSGGGSRKAVMTYDEAGRQKTSQITGGGVAIPKLETIYDSTLGLPKTQQFVCPVSEPGCDTQATTTTYDTLGRATSYQDADGITAETTYDFLGRPATVNDGKGTQTLKYDSVTGLLVELEDSAAGTFTASYDADGNLVKRGLPNGLTAETTFDETGAAVDLTYTKASSCGLTCNWLDFTLERSIHGQILNEYGTLGKDEYVYDKIGRLVTAKETPAGGSCTTRSYKYDKDSNREEMTTIPGALGACSSSGGATQKYSYDSADRLLGEGLTYDDFGRITSLPAAFAGGKALSTTYFSNDMVATQTQNGVTNTFQLDAMLRQRQRLQAGGLEGTEVFHYSGPGDSPTWTQRGSTWTRSIAGIGGELAATQESGKEVELKLTNLHGDVVATAALNPSATELKGTFQFDEFGNPTGGSAGRFAWLGGKQRRTELASGVIQMGARSYVPSLGRFLTPDPILGGAANPYDYANQDPVNAFDLAGTCSTKKGCNHIRRARRNQAEGRVDNIRERMQKARAARANKARALGLGVEGVHFPKLPWEKEVGKALNKIENSLVDLFTKDCGETAEAFAYAGGTAAGVGVLLQAGGPVAGAVGGMLINLGAGAGIAAGIFFGASKLNVC